MLGWGGEFLSEKSSRAFRIDDKTVDRALALPFLALALASLLQSLWVQGELLRLQLLCSVPLNVLAAHSFWVRGPALEPTAMSEVVVPSLSFLLPFLILNQGLLFGATFSFPELFPATIVGLIWSFVSLTYLRRSFAIFPTVRGVVVKGPYRLVRHPLYLGELLYLIGAMMLGFNLLSLGLLALALVLLKLRIDLEERKMMTQAAYCAYAQRVRHRLLPLIY